MIDASAYRNSWPTPSNASKRCQHRAFRWPHVAHDLGAGAQKTTETPWHFAELLLCPEVVGTRHQAGPRRPEAIHGNSFVEKSTLHGHYSIIKGMCSARIHILNAGRPVEAPTDAGIRFCEA